MKFLTIGSENSRRLKFWEDALQQYNCKHDFITYEQVINFDFPKITAPTLLRITSPGEDFNLKKMILSLGDFPDAENLVFQKGLIYPNQNWYSGWWKVLEKIKVFILLNPLLQVMNTPAAIQLAFHKLKCQQLLIEQGIATPKIILSQLSNYDTFIQTLVDKNIHQVFIKPYHGSSASGVMAFRQSNGKQMLYTTIALKDNGQLFNHLKLQKYNSIEKIKTIINAMIPSGLLVEEWIRKKTYQQKSVDFRILVVNG